MHRPGAPTADHPARTRASAEAVVVKTERCSLPFVLPVVERPECRSSPVGTSQSIAPIASEAREIPAAEAAAVAAAAGNQLANSM